MMSETTNINANDKKVIIIGLDGCTFDLIMPWIKRGHLPNLERMLKEGAWGKLRSTTHPISPVAWTSFKTGKNPGKHSIFSWEVLKKNSYDATFFNSGEVKSSPFWEGTQKTVGTVNLLGTYPVEKINGYVISGMLTPSTKSDFTYPKELKEELFQNIGDYRIATDVKYLAGKEREFYDDLKEIIENREKVFLYMLREHPCDINIFVFMETDALHHKFWRFLDPTNPHYSPEEAEEYSKLALDLYKRIDDAVGRLRDEAGNDAYIMIMSDHGAGNSLKRFLLNSWLLDKGLMRFKLSPMVAFKRALNKYRLFYRIYACLSKLGLGSGFYRFSKSTREKAATGFFSLSSDLDWKRTKAFYGGNCGLIRLNVKGREPKGCVKPGKEYEKVADFIKKELLKLEDSETGEKVVDEVVRREDIYWGDHTDDAPDIIFSMKNHAYEVSKQLTSRPGNYFEDNFATTGNSGEHQMDGIFILAGPEIKAKEIKGASILDVAPTVLSLLGEDISLELDGKKLDV